LQKEVQRGLAAHERYRTLLMDGRANEAALWQSLERQRANAAQAAAMGEARASAAPEEGRASARAELAEAAADAERRLDALEQRLAAAKAAAAHGADREGALRP
jgi:hypothetical protein